MNNSRFWQVKERMLQARDLPPKRIPNVKLPKTMLADPELIDENLGFKRNNNRLSYTSCAMIPDIVPLAQVLNTTDVNQRLRFLTPSESNYQAGFRIVPRDKKKMTRADEKEAQRITRFLEHCGADPDWSDDNLDTFFRKFWPDSLMFDQANMEKVYTNKGDLAFFMHTDATTVRIADQLYYADQMHASKIKYVQIDGKERIINKFEKKDMGFFVRNPCARVSNYGYGTPEYQKLSPVIAGLIFGFDYNMNIFRNGVLTNGLLSLSGQGWGEEKIQRFKDELYENMNGSENAHKFPILVGDENVQWVNFNQSNRDMEFSAWMTYLTKLFCAQYGKDPGEMNMYYGNEGGSSLFESSTVQKLTSGKDKGLRPMMQTWCNFMNAEIVYRLNPDFKMIITGLDEDQDQAMERQKKLTETMFTINQVLEQEGYKPLGPEGDIILNPYYMQRLQMLQQEQEQDAEPGVVEPQEGIDDDTDADFDFDIAAALEEAGDEADVSDTDDEAGELTKALFSEAFSRR